MSLKTNQKKKGFSLLELIIAIFILALAVLTFSKISFVDFKTSNSNKQRLEALVAAENYLELIKAKRESNEITNENTLRVFLANEGFNDRGGYLGKAQVINNINYDITAYIDGANQKLIEIIIEVKPQDANLVRVGTKLFFNTSP